MLPATSTIRLRRAALAAMAALLAAAAASAAVPVEESVARQGGERGAPARQSAPAEGAVDTRALQQSDTTSDTGRLSQLFYQLQVLQQEMQELRGMVEEQGHRLERLSRDQQDQYLDLDRRMQALREGTGTAPARTDSAAGPGRDADAPSGSRGGAAGSEREAYADAFDLMKQRQFEASAEAFEALIERYPNGAYTPNAFYWLGELHLAEDRYEAARQAFAQVVNLYPDHQKVPDALYKLGVAYHRLGDVDRAREYLNRVRSEHPQSSAAGLAQTYLAEL